MNLQNLKVNPETFIVAARLIAEFKDEFACLAITKSSLIWDLNERCEASCLFEELYYEDADLSPGTMIWWTKGSDKQNRAARVIALLLAAEVAKDGGL